MALGLHLNLQTMATLFALLCYGGLIYVVLRHGLRGNRLNQVFSLYLLPMVLWQLAYLMVSISDSAERALFWYGVVVAVVSGQFILYFVFTSTLLRIRSSSPLVQVGLLVWGLTVVWILLGKEPTFFTGIQRDAATGLFVPIFGPLLPIVAAPNYAFLGYAVLCLLRSYRNTKSDLQRSRIQYLLLGVGLVVLGSAANLVPHFQPYPIDVGANIINAFCIAYAIYRYQLLNIRLVVRKGLLYSIPTAIIGLAYFTIAFAAVRLFHLVAGYQLVLSLIIGAVTAVVVEPLRNKVQVWGDGHFFREQYDSSLMLEGLSGTAASVLDQDKLTGMILDAVTTTMHIGRAALFLKQEGSGELRLVAQRGLDESPDIWLREDHPIVDWLRRHAGILTRRDVEVLPLFKALWGQEKADLEGMGAELFIPLKVKGELVGIFAVGSKLSEQAYSQADQLTLATLANQTAVAVANARLYTAAQRRGKESLVLLDIATAVSSTLDLTRVLKLITRRTAEACGAHRCSIFLLDEKRQRILPLMSQFASGTMDEQLWERYRHKTYVEPIDNVPALNQVLLDRQPLVLDADTIGCLPEGWVTPFNIHALLLVPLVSRDRVIGAMALDQVEPGKRFEQEQINLAVTIGSQAAAAIGNARLYEQTIQEKARAEAILQETFSGIVVVDASLHLVSMNPGAEQITGYTAEEVLGKRIDEVFGAEIAAPGSPLTRACETGAKVPPAETVLSVRQGSKDVLLGVTPLPTGNQSPAGCLLSFTDISKLKEVDRLKSSIVANVSHELRTPLTSIKAYSELLLAGAEDEDAKLRQDWLEVIDQEIDRVIGLVNDILNLARLESQRVKLTKRPLDLGGFITSVVDLLQVQAEQRNVTVTLDVQPDLPQLLADRGLMETVVKNLVGNAIKFNHEGGRVHVSVWEDGENLLFSVQDWGTGIPEDAIPHLFTKFFRAASSDAAAVQGTGLGLALVKEAVTAHGGHIEVESASGKGSRFTVVLPKTGYLALDERNTSREELGTTVPSSIDSDKG